LIAWAEAMGHTEAASLLHETLEEEKAADEKLSSLAEGGINQEAADAAHPDSDEEEEGEPVGVGAGGGRRASGAGGGRSSGGRGNSGGRSSGKSKGGRR
jgi:hypothetical protein